MASARLNSFSPNNDVTYTLGNYYPQAVDEFAGDPITNPLNITSGRQAWFVRVAFPRTYAWAAIGFGSEMNGARIFVVYTDGEGNVTVSPRRGTGHVEPQYDETVVNEGWLRVLEGSGDNIEDELREDLPMQTLAPRQYVKRQSDDDDDDDDGDDDDRRMVVANFLYITGKDGSRQPMIGSWQEGTPLATSELGARITKHDGHFQWRVENTDRIYVGATTNPFLPGGDRSNDAQENIEDSWDSDFDGRDDDDWISFLKTKTSERFTHAHGALMGIAFMFLFPLSAIIMRFSATRKLWLHLVLNVLAILCIIAGVAVGAYIKHKKGYVSSSNCSLAYE